jgi:hypothetical protein
MTAFLLARGADPQAPGASTPAEAEAEFLGHWLAAEIIRAWTRHPAQRRSIPPALSQQRVARRNVLT